MEQNELKNIVSHFAIRGTVSDIKPLVQVLSTTPCWLQQPRQMPQTTCCSV